VIAGGARPLHPSGLSLIEVRRRGLRIPRRWRVGLILFGMRTADHRSCCQDQCQEMGLSHARLHVRAPAGNRQVGTCFRTKAPNNPWLRITR